MGNYEKPTVTRINDSSEGIYLASGTKSGCESKYMNGVWHQQNWNITTPTPRIDAYGCRGCAADDGHKCKLQYQDKWNGGIFMPIWEQEGKDPYENVNY